MPKNPTYATLGGDTPGETGTGCDYGVDVQVSKASYETNYDYGATLKDVPKAALKKGYVEIKK